MEASELNSILEQHRLWIDGKGGKRANLCGADLRDANLTDANLMGADLRDANLTDANLMGADLYRAILMGADLRGSSLTGADLRGSSLMGANLTGADLSGADLTGANLSYANLSYANLRGANLNGADLTNAILPDISWIIPGCLVQLNHVMCEFYLEKEDKWDNFVQDSFGFFIQDNPAEGTFDMLAGDRIIRNIPDWVKYTGLKKIESV